jgi:hypothetical protein
MNLSLRLHSGQMVNIQNSKRVFVASGSVKTMRCESHPKVLLLSQHTFNGFLSKRLIDLFSLANKAESELKEIIKRTRFTKVLKSRMSEVSSHLRVELLKALIDCLEPEVIHLRKPETFLDPGEVQLLLGSIFTYSGSIIVESDEQPLTGFFDSIVSDSTLLESELPSNLDEVKWYESQNRFTLHAQVLQQESELILNLEELKFLISKEDCASFIGLVNQELLANIGLDSFDVSIREKPGMIKVPTQILKQTGLQITGKIDTKKSTLFIPIHKRPPTPFLWLSLNPQKLYLFHPQTKQRIYPAKS